uniref:Cytochrome P450 n=1 Tax=Solanum lycopersicum TaxID=4081 RepID=A0A3Q7FRV4_SOLLC
MEILHYEVWELVQGKTEVTKDDLGNMQYLKAVIKEFLRLHPLYPLSWDDPDEYRPERFLNSNIDFRGINFELIPFGASRRGCPGINFNRASISKDCTQVQFSIRKGTKNEDLDMSECTGITIHRKLPLLAVATLFAT